MIILQFNLNSIHHILYTWLLSRQINWMLMREIIRIVIMITFVLLKWI